VNKTGEILREYVGEYRDTLGELVPSEESRVLEEEYRDVGMKVIQERMKVRRLILLILAGVMLSVRYRGRSETILTPAVGLIGVV